MGNKVGSSKQPQQKQNESNNVDPFFQQQQMSNNNNDDYSNNFQQQDYRTNTGNHSIKRLNCKTDDDKKQTVAVIVTFQ